MGRGRREVSSTPQTDGEPRTQHGHPPRARWSTPFHAEENLMAARAGWGGPSVCPCGESECAGAWGRWCAPARLRVGPHLYNMDRREQRPRWFQPRRVPRFGAVGVPTQIHPKQLHPLIILPNLIAKTPIMIPYLFIARPTSIRPRLRQPLLPCRRRRRLLGSPAVSRSSAPCTTTLPPK